MIDGKRRTPKYAAIFVLGVIVGTVVRIPVVLLPERIVTAIEERLLS